MPPHRWMYIAQFDNTTEPWGMNFSLLEMEDKNQTADTVSWQWSVSVWIR